MMFFCSGPFAGKTAKGRCRFTSTRPVPVVSRSVRLKVDSTSDGVPTVMTMRAMDSVG